MSRSLWALCAFVLAATPVVAIASNSTDFERADAFRFAINSVIGDASFIARYGEPPSPATDPDLRVHTHLAFVHELLSQRDTSSMSAELRAARERNLANFREYIDAGIFPRNHAYRDQTRPCFIDDDGRICAVGYLVEQSAGLAVAELINAKFQYAFVAEIQLPELDRWVASSGLSLEELSLIQPCYNPEFNVTVERTGDLTVTVRGYVVEYCCGLSSVTFNFGDAIWMSPPKGYGYAIKATHTYSRPGSYMITGRAISTAWCDYEVREMSWIVNVGTTPLKVSAVKLPGGPPYRVYLTTTDEIRLDCPLSTIVQWEQYYGSPQPTTWYLENGVYRTPTHDYSSKATRTITVANSYGPDCAVDQAGSVTVNVNGLATTGDATRVATTWGAIKAMYR